MSRKIVLTLLFSSYLSLLALEYDVGSYDERLSQGLGDEVVIVDQSNVPTPYRNVTKTPINSSSSPSRAVTAQPLAPGTPSKPTEIPRGPMPEAPSSPLLPQSIPTSSSSSNKPSNVKPSSVTAVPNVPIIVAPAIIPFLPVPKPISDHPTIITTPPVVPPTQERPTRSNNPSTIAPAPPTTSPVIPPYTLPTSTKSPATVAPIPAPYRTKQPIITTSPIVPPVLQPHITAPVLQPINSIPSSQPVQSNLPVSKPSQIPIIAPTTQQPKSPVPTPTMPTPSGNHGSKGQGSTLWKAFTYLFLVSLLAYGIYLGYVNRGTIIFILGRMVIECAFRIRRFISQIRYRLRRMTGRRRGGAEPSLNEILFEDSTQAELSTRLLSNNTESTE